MVSFNGEILTEYIFHARETFSLGRQCVYVATLIFAVRYLLLSFFGQLQNYAYQQKIEMGILRDL